MTKIVTDYDVEELAPGDEIEYTKIATRQEQVEHETERAILFLLDGTKHWVPRYKVRRDHRGSLWVLDTFIEAEFL